ncbi:MAG: mechanosensitive ion channel [Candidatus Aureabacteria bacterium]|nr:mechanosensitive ion channel [Candidatus Auribacterota bacterium]
MTKIIEEFSKQLPVIAPKIIMGLLIFLIFWFIALLAGKIVVVIGLKAHIQKNIITLLGRTLRIILVILGVISALGTMGINVSALVASLGLTGFALGFALRDALSNVLAGTLILIYRPFQCGDRIKITGFEGDVVCIDLRYTTLKADNKEILIPNSNLFNNPVVILQRKS